MRRMTYSGNLGKPMRGHEWGKSRGGTWTRTARLHKACHPTCANCGAIHELETDHIVPLHRGGTNAWSNLQSLCTECHKLKSAQELRDGA